MSLIFFWGILIQDELYTHPEAIIIVVDGPQAFVARVEEIARRQGFQVDRGRVCDVVFLHVHAVVLVNRLPANN